METIINVIGSARLHTYIIWCSISYIMLTLSIVLDIISAFIGIMRINGKWTSQRQRECISKLYKYYLPLIGLTFVDALLLVVLQVPMLTMVFTLICCLTEWLSIYENTNSRADKDRYKRVSQLVIKNKDQLINILTEIIDNDNQSNNTKQSR